MIVGVKKEESIFSLVGNCSLIDSESILSCPCAVNSLIKQAYSFALNPRLQLLASVVLWIQIYIVTK